MRQNIHFQTIAKNISYISNPSTNRFAWVGVEQAEIIFLNDFRWSEKLISWQDLLKLLEGDAVHIAAPKTHFSKDIVMDKDTPIFATSISPIRFLLAVPYVLPLDNHILFI